MYACGNKRGGKSLPARATFLGKVSLVCPHLFDKACSSNGEGHKSLSWFVYISPLSHALYPVSADSSIVRHKLSDIYRGTDRKKQGFVSDRHITQLHVTCRVCENVAGVTSHRVPLTILWVWNFLRCLRTDLCTPVVVHDFARQFSVAVYSVSNSVVFYMQITISCSELICTINSWSFPTKPSLSYLDFCTICVCYFTRTCCLWETVLQPCTGIITALELLQK